MSQGTNMFDYLQTHMLINQKENMLMGIVYMYIIRVLWEFFNNTIIPLCKEYIDNKIKKGKEALTTKLQTITNNMHEITYQRLYTSVQNNWDEADSIIHAVLKIPASQSTLKIADLEIIKNSEPFSINENMKFKMLNYFIKDSSVSQLEFKVFSDTISICDMREFIREMTEEFVIHKKNKLGEQLYYFDHIAQNYRNIGNIPSLKFTKSVFNTNRTMDNVFHERETELKTRVDLFLNNKDWYNKRGIPRSLGLFFTGPPGTGKTSTIKAIAKMSKRHVINISLANIKSKKHLKKLFFDEKINVCKNYENIQDTEEYIIPINKRLYVLEDMDAIKGDLLMSRKNETKIVFVDEAEKIQKDMMNRGEATENDELDLSTILNVVDGTLEPQDRIIIYSTNYIEKLNLDEAFIRPGRIDMVIEFNKCTRKMLKDLFENFYEVKIDPEKLEKIDEYKWTPAEVSAILFKNFYTPERSIQDLIELDPRVYFKWSYFGKESERSEEVKVEFTSSIDEFTGKTVPKEEMDLKNPISENSISNVLNMDLKQLLKSSGEIPSEPSEIELYSEPSEIELYSGPLDPLDIIKGLNAIKKGFQPTGKHVKIFKPSGNIRTINPDGTTPTDWNGEDLSKTLNLESSFLKEQPSEIPNGSLLETHYKSENGNLVLQESANNPIIQKQRESILPKDKYFGGPDGKCPENIIWSPDPNGNLAPMAVKDSTTEFKRLDEIQTSPIQSELQDAQLF